MRRFLLCRFRSTAFFASYAERKSITLPGQRNLLSRRSMIWAFIVQRGPRHLPDLYHYLGFLKLIWAKMGIHLTQVTTSR
jgi:hypothetical protein